mmetsp:Transcript_27011/g.49760  ORF Transcript_27011/g.49760 Transcript_27011/m.49760 type:complete len:81 (-) Transcript_27011:53-295(-)
MHGVHMMVGRVGNDVMGHHSSISSLQSKGIKLNENEAMVVGAHTGVASIAVDSTTGQNTIVVVPWCEYGLEQGGCGIVLG